jgi:sugar phosphate permease
MGMCVSSGVSIPVFAALLAGTNTLTVPFAVFGAASIAVAVITALFVKEWPEQAGAYPDNEEISAGQIKQNRELMASYKSEWTPAKLFRCGQMWLVSVTFGLLFIALMATMTQFIPRFMAAGFTNEEAIMWLSITAVLGVVGSYLWGYLDQKTNTKLTVVIYAAYMCALQFLNAMFFDSKAVSTVLIVFMGILIGGIGNLFPSMVIQIFGRYDFAAANSVCVPVLTAIRACTFILIAVVMGATMGSYRILCVVLGVLSLAAVLLSLKLSNKTIGKAQAEQ